MTCFNTELKRVMQSRKRAEAEARRLMKTTDSPGEFEYVLPAETIRVRVRQATLRQQLNSNMSSKQVLAFLRRAWTPEELRKILLKARTTEPVLERIANRNRKLGTFAPTIPEPMRPGRTATALAPCLYAFARGRRGAGASFYEPLLALDLRAHPHRVLHIEPVVQALMRWGAPPARLSSEAQADLNELAAPARA